MSKQEILELAKKYNCVVEFGENYFKPYKREENIKFTTFSKAPIEEFMMNNQGKNIYICTVKDDNVLWGDKTDNYWNYANHFNPPYIWLRAVVY